MSIEILASKFPDIMGTYTGLSVKCGYKILCNLELCATTLGTETQ